MNHISQDDHPFTHARLRQDWTIDGDFGFFLYVPQREGNNMVISPVFPGMTEALTWMQFHGWHRVPSDAPEPVYECAANMRALELSAFELPDSEPMAPDPTRSLTASTQLRDALAQLGAGIIVCNAIVAGAFGGSMDAIVNQSLGIGAALLAAHVYLTRSGWRAPLRDAKALPRRSQTRSRRTARQCPAFTPIIWPGESLPPSGYAKATRGATASTRCSGQLRFTRYSSATSTATMAT